MKRVLLIEDDADLGEAYALALEKLDLIVHIATTGTQGIDYFKSTTKPPTLLVITDDLPDMSGMDVIRRIPHADELKIILITDNIPEEDSTDAQLVNAFLAPAEARDRIPPLVNSLLTG